MRAFHPTRNFIRMASPHIDRGAMRGRGAVSQMADDMRVIAATADCITEADLEVLGWTRAQVASVGAAARSKAYADAAEQRAHDRARSRRGKAAERRLRAAS